MKSVSDAHSNDDELVDLVVLRVLVNEMTKLLTLFFVTQEVRQKGMIEGLLRWDMDRLYKFLAELTTSSLVEIFEDHEFSAQAPKTMRLSI